MDLGLKGEHVLITGGSQGIGFACAQAFVAQGARVTLVARNTETLAKARGQLMAEGASADQVHTVSADLRDANAALQALDQAEAVAGPVQVLVNSAGITGPNVKVWDYPVDAWKQVFDVNVHGLFHCCRELSAHMKTRNYGRIVNIASVAGKDGNPNASAYSASKAAVIGLTKSLGKELADTGVRVNCVTPAAVKTAIFDQMTPEHIQFMLSKIPMARFGEPEEVAAMVTWLSTEECSFSTGAVFDLSGGRSTY